MAVARHLVRDLYHSPAGDRLRYHRGLPHLYDGTHWTEIAVRDIRRAAYAYLEHATYVDAETMTDRPWAPSRRKLTDVLDALEAVTLIESRLDASAWLDPHALPASEIVSVANGLLHVPTRTLLEHTPAYYTHHALPFAFVEDPPEPQRWLAFLQELWPDDPTAIETMQEVMGYLLAGGTRQQKIFLIVGPKRAGKGTIARVLTGLLGPHNIASPTLSSLATNFGISPLIGKPLALIADARLGAKSESSIVVERLLSISGEDSLTVDRKYRDPWTGRLPTRFLILTNELPRLHDVSGALASRFISFVLTRSWYGSENPGLTEELLEEAPSIFRWALDGLDRCTHRGRFVIPDSSRDVLQRMEDLASPISAFIRQRCHVGADATIECDDLWAAWKQWCQEENRHPGTKALFSRDLHAAVPTIRRIRPRKEGSDERPYHYAGIVLSRDYSARSSGPDGPDGGPGPRGPRDQTLYSPQDDEADRV